MRYLSFNMQAAIQSSGYWAYSYEWPRQLFPSKRKQKTLSAIVDCIAPYDVVALQEIDFGGFRSGVNQLKQLRQHHPFVHFQINRRVGKLSLHGNAILSKVPLQACLDTPLPGKIRGRGVLAAKIADVVVACIHLSLGVADQRRQLAFIAQALHGHEKVLLLGDFNQQPDSDVFDDLRRHGYQLLHNQHGEVEKTFPAWRAKKALDQAWARGLSGEVATLAVRLSDHLPLLVNVNEE